MFFSPIQKRGDSYFNACSGNAGEKGLWKQKPFYYPNTLVFVGVLK
jgi:hypothetical protein